MNPITFRDIFPALSAETGLSKADVRRVFDAILAGEWTPVQIAGFVVGLRLRGESSEVIAAAAEAMRAAMVPVEHDFDQVLDTCGTGGDGHGTVNISTGAAIIVAGAGVPVAKHGNRAVSSRAGSADVLEALGIPLDLAPAAAAQVLREAQISFLMAPQHHPAMRHAAAVRRELGVRSIFNCLGPLANPARATHQLLGAYDDKLRLILAETLAALGVTSAWVVHSRDGMDELSPFAPTRITEVRGTKLRELELSPRDFGLEPSPEGAIRGGDAAENAEILKQVLSGKPHPSRTAFLLNSAAALTVAKDIPLSDAARLAAESIDSGASAAALERWRQAAIAQRG